MSTVIKNGTIVTHDLTYKSDILIDGSTIVEIGPNLKGNNELDASDCYIMPGGIDPHTHLEMPFMGTYSSDDFESGTRAALAGGTTMVVDFALPSPGESLLDAIKRWIINLHELIAIILFIWLLHGGEKKFLTI